MASLMSDVAAIGDFDDEDDSVNNGIHFSPPIFLFITIYLPSSSQILFLVVDSMQQSLHEVLDLTAQMDKLTQSLSGSEFVSTPISSKSLLHISIRSDLM